MLLFVSGEMWVLFQQLFKDRENGTLKITENVSSTHFPLNMEKSSHENEWVNTQTKSIYTDGHILNLGWFKTE